LGEETSETETEEEEEIEEYILVKEPEQHEIIEKEIEEKTEKPPEKTKITRDKKVKGLDYCPYCESTNLGKDHKKDIYVCLDCGRTYKIE